MRLLAEGARGVSFFFVLSGFILAYNYAERLTTIGRTAARRFYVSRLARIYPLHALTFVIAAMAVIGQWQSVGVRGAVAAASQVTLTQAFLPMANPFDRSQLACVSFDAPAWTLSCEAFFYAVFPFLVVALARRRTGHVVAIAAAAWAWEVLVALEVRGTQLAGVVAYFAPCVRLAEFIAGVCAGLIFVRRARLPGSGGRWTLVEVLSLGLLGAAVVASPAVPETLRYGSYYIPVFVFVLVVVVFGAERGRLSRALTDSRLVFLGEISFAFYLLHMLLLRAAHWLGWLPGGIRSVAALTGVFAVTLAASVAIFVMYERPLRSLVLRRLLTARPSAG